MSDDYDKELRKLLLEKGYSKCSHCNKEIDRGDIAWNNGSTEYGTGYCTVECICQRCDKEVFVVRSWYPSIDDLDDVITVLKDDLSHKESEN